MSAGRAPSGGARDQVGRLLTLVPYLYHRDEVRLDEAAELLGVSAKQLVKDLKVLWMCGTPELLTDDLIDVDMDALEEGVVHVSNADYLARPLRLTSVEASAMIVALRALRAGSGPETQEIVDRLLGKLETAAAEAGAAALIDPGTDSTGSDEDLAAAVLEQAVAQRRQVRLTYYVPARDEQSTRTVDPHRIVSEAGKRYLDAWCHSAEAPRWFRLDRIEEVALLSDPVGDTGSRDDTLPTAMFEQADAGGAHVVTLTLGPEASWVPEYYPVLAQRAAADGRLEVDLVVSDPRWLTRLLLRLAPYAEVNNPGEFAEALIDTARGTLSLYR